MTLQHVDLLKRYWTATFGCRNNAPAFERTSPLWQLDAGFSTANPALDLRSMGELGLLSLVYFVETHAGETKMMRRSCGGYPFVKAAMAVARALCEALFLIDEQRVMGGFPVTKTLYWQLLETEQSFFQLFALCFLLFEDLYCEAAASDRSLQQSTAPCSTAVVARLVNATKQQLLHALTQAPNSLEDLRHLCRNASQAVNVKPLAAAESQHACPSSFASAHGPGTQKKMPPVVNDCSRWRKHVTTRKSLRDIGLTWTLHDETLEQAARRLRPRAPEVVLKSSSSQRSTSASAESMAIGATAGADSDLFEGLLVSKPLMDASLLAKSA